VNPGLKQQNLKLNYRAGYFAKTIGGEPPQLPASARRTTNSRSRVKDYTNFADSRLNPCRSVAKPVILHRQQLALPLFSTLKAPDTD
jgi:hypothetical protein